MIKQISVFVENKPGRLAEITKIIADNNINICALSIADTSHFGILRCIVDDPERAEKALKAAELTVSITSVISLKIPDRPGGLAKALEVLASAGITVEYAYAFVSKSEDEAYVVLRVEEDFRAMQILKANGYEL